jgi:cytochrome c peroxidase
MGFHCPLSDRPRSPRRTVFQSTRRRLSGSIPNWRRRHGHSPTKEVRKNRVVGAALAAALGQRSRACGTPATRRLLTPSRWDKFLEGDQAALSNAEKAGFNKFMEVGCQACHAGAYPGGDVFQKLGAMKPYPDASDVAREAATKEESDRMVFKVPSLRLRRESSVVDQPSATCLRAT